MQHAPEPLPLSTTYTEVPLRGARVARLREGVLEPHTAALHKFLGFKSRSFVLGGVPYIYTIRHDESDPEDLLDVVHRLSASNSADAYTLYEKIPGKIVTYTFVAADYELYEVLGSDLTVLVAHEMEEQYDAPVPGFLSAIVTFMARDLSDITVKFPDALRRDQPPLLVQDLAKLYGAEYVAAGTHEGKSVFALDGLGKIAAERYEAYLLAQV